jgi:type IV fimbrial biogenesis protein FimT
VRNRAMRQLPRPTAAPGLTLLELLTSLALGGVLLALGLPAYRAWVADLEMRDRIEALVVTMSRARSEAIKRQSRVVLCPSDDGRSCAGGGRWEGGWIVFADTNDDGDRDPDELLIAVEPPSRPGITIRGNRPVSQYVSYTSYGHTRMTNGALQMGTLTVCRSGSKAVDVVLANGGRVRVDRTRAKCARRRKLSAGGPMRAM